MEVHTRSTSANTAECDPIVLRETDRVRLVFLPTIVNNTSSPEASVRGWFVYQKKSKVNGWVPVETIPLSTLKNGEGYKLELHAGELAALGHGLRALYLLHRQEGVPIGQTKFVQVQAGLAQVIAMSEGELASFLEAHQQDAANILGKFLRWLAGSPQGAAAASRLTKLDQADIPPLVSILGLATVKDALKHWKANETNDREEFWQETLADRAYVLSQVFAYPVVVIQEKAYLGGKTIANKGGTVVDFLAAAESTDAIALIEIKTPATRLLGAEYRSTFPLSQDLMGAVSQALLYRQTLMRNFHNLFKDHEKRVTLGEPRCLVLAGNSGELKTAAMKEAFELQRERLQGVTVLTYDELFRRLERLLSLLEGV